MVGEAPACIECEHVKMEPYKSGEDEESVRMVRGVAVRMVCERARDSLTGAAGELCSVERATGLCGPRGLLFSQGKKE